MCLAGKMTMLLFTESAKKKALFHETNFMLLQQGENITAALQLCAKAHRSLV